MKTAFARRGVSFQIGVLVTKFRDTKGDDHKIETSKCRSETATSVHRLLDPEGHRFKTEGQHHHRCLKFVTYIGWQCQ